MIKRLVIDIGGTNSRFGDCTCLSHSNFKINQIFTIDTRHSDIHTFLDFINVYNSHKPEIFLTFDDYESVCIAVAGPVINNECNPPNISWNINLNNTDLNTNIVLLNDFEAQAYAFTRTEIFNDLLPIRKSKQTYKGNSAIIGAGTGLGHALISRMTNNLNEFQIIASEAGQSGFTFTENEQEIKSFFHKKLKNNWISNDKVVSGSGLALLHEFISGEHKSPKEILKKPETDNETLSLFSRFYARACRNYCLTNAVSENLILSGGIAAKHPYLVNNSSFFDEFENTSTHRNILQKISICLNKNENIGLTGALIYLFSSTHK